MDDLHEYEQMKKQQEKRKCGDISDASFLLTNNIANLKSRVQQQREAQHERIGNSQSFCFFFWFWFSYSYIWLYIGYVPAPRPPQ